MGFALFKGVPDVREQCEYRTDEGITGRIALYRGYTAETRTQQRCAVSYHHISFSWHSFWWIQRTFLFRVRGMQHDSFTFFVRWQLRLKQTRIYIICMRNWLQQNVRHRKICFIVQSPLSALGSLEVHSIRMNVSFSDCKPLPDPGVALEFGPP